MCGDLCVGYADGPPEPLPTGDDLGVSARGLLVEGQNPALEVVAEQRYRGGLAGSDRRL